MSLTEDPDLVIPRVFIAYSHDSEWHKKQVRELATLLRTQLAIDARFDQWESEDRRDWSQWAINELAEADFVLAIASPDFRARAGGTASPHDGRGAQFEGAMLRNKMTEDRGKWVGKILPVVLPGNTIDDIPEFLMRGQSRPAAGAVGGRPIAPLPDR
ncbi:MAG TPA: SEFIR domain-containing protein [Pseudonocardiaceae bacterium]|nr:SEFIR domain-containing protein [Pseudonocardiaceae bacterium]